MKITLSKSQWQFIGQKTGWIKSAMAQPTKYEKSQTYYHGTSKKQNGESILQDGSIKAPDLSKTKEYFTRPIPGNVYISPSLNFVMSYVLGGNIAGTDYFEPKQYGEIKYKEEPFGYLFIIEGKELIDIQMDEDSLGEILSDIATKIETNKFKNGPKATDKEIWLLNWAKSILSPNMMKKLLEGEYIYWAKGGKILLKKMNQNMKRWLMDNFIMGSIQGIAHTGNIKWKEAWKFNKIKTKQLKPDGSNFFSLAERII